MAIKKGLNARISEIGKIKIGGKGAEKTSKKDGKEKKWRQPVKFGHFKVTATERGPDGNFLPDDEVMKTLKEKQGTDEPKELRIRFPFDDIDMNFHTSYQFYNGSKLACKGDGEKAVRKDNDGNMVEAACDTDTCQYMKSGKCKVSGILSCYLPDSPSFGGVYRFRTHGWNSVGGILKALQDYSKYTGGILQGLPFKLKFIKKHTEEHGNVPVVALVMDGVELNDMRRLAIEEKKGRAELSFDMKALELEVREAGYEPDTDDPEDVEAEFYTEDEPDGPGTSAEDVTAELQAEKDALEKSAPAEPEATSTESEEKTDKDLF